MASSRFNNVIKLWRLSIAGLFVLLVVFASLSLWLRLDRVGSNNPVLAAIELQPASRSLNAASPRPIAARYWRVKRVEQLGEVQLEIEAQHQPQPFEWTIWTTSIIDWMPGVAASSSVIDFENVSYNGRRLVAQRETWARIDTDLLTLLLLLLVLVAVIPSVVVRVKGKSLPRGIGFPVLRRRRE